MYMYMYMYMCIYIYIYRERERERERHRQVPESTANLRTNILDFRGFDSSIILILWGAILMSIGDFPESLSRAILVGIMFVGRLGVSTRDSRSRGLSLRGLAVYMLRKGGWYRWKPSSSSNCSFRAFRADLLIETRQTAPCRAIRGNIISVNSTLLPSYCWSANRRSKARRWCWGNSLALKRGTAKWEGTKGYLWVT